MASPDPAHDVLGSERRQPLDAILKPKSVAVIGATEKVGSVGRTVLWNLMSTPFGGPIFPVNPTRSSVLGIKAYPNISAVPEKVDMAVITTPAASVPNIIKECADAGLPGAVIISAGFKETGPAGVELERQILAHARRSGMRIIGPNCLGVMNPINGVNATFASAIARRGNVGFISQSGALCTAVLDWSLKEMVGFSAFVSIGSMLDIGWGDLISYLGSDPNTKSIVIYMETIGDARAFLSAAREVALTKPIIIIKPGRTEGAARAAASHTGSLTGSDEVLEAAFRRCGVLRVNDISDLFHMSEVLSKQPRPRGPRMTLITNAGGPGVLATDALLSSGGELAEITPQTVDALNKILPAHWSHNNPIDVLGDASADVYAKTLEIAGRDVNSDGLLVILTPQAMTDATATADKLREFGQIENKPVLASWMGGTDVATGEAILNRAGIPTFSYPDTAARMFTAMWRYSDNLRALYETPSTRIDLESVTQGRAQAAKIIEGVRRSQRTILTEFESKELLAAYGVPIVLTRIARTVDEAVQMAEGMKYPVVLKLFSETITHKTDVGGVQLNLGSADAVRQAFHKIQTSVAEKAGAQHFQGVTVQQMIKLSDGYELILGSSIDPQFGPVLLFGTGGQLVEVFKDRALGLPPLNTTLARRMMEQTKIFTALKGVRGRKSVDMPALERLMVNFSQLVAEQPWIKEIDINPLFASADHLVALDARVILHDPATPEEQLPKLAIRPYPNEYVSQWTLKDQSAATIRPIRPEDEPLMVKFHETLTERSVYQRYFQPINLADRIAHERLTCICFNDYDREIALVVERANPKSGAPEILGVGRLSKVPFHSEAEFAILIADAYQRQGMGSELLRLLLKIARQEKIAVVRAKIHPENHEMRRICERLKFHLVEAKDEPLIRAEIKL
ncbi:MAG TPA: bifunctional acetate--CoA ligase family protein/GNAT family N-acetyltransferase [Candidatus Paceibacterota bacterium]|nr:bifunctional acetate--CoA ligase family protein/GNAT family N-acetyltransferase [Verrucomicrobiota bacterium]HRZ47205.1 bifunctional acetate--CoA ligase family protein/GNAT family N-acetyltransferase [Candidatus Paceibacterota bacterium]